MKKIFCICILSLLISSLFSQAKKSMADSDLFFEPIDLLTTGNNRNLETKYGNSAKGIHIGSLKDDWRLGNIALNNESIFTRTEKGFIIERKVQFQESWQGAVESPRFILHPKKTYKISFRAKASKPVTVAISLDRRAEPWDNAGFWQSISLGKDFNNYSFTFSVKDDVYCGFSLTELGKLSDVIIQLEDYNFEEVKK